LVVGALRLELGLPGIRSLKAKRGLLSSLLSELRSRFQVACAEVGSNDLWQTAVIGIAVVANSRPRVESRLEAVERFVQRWPHGYVTGRELCLY